MESGKLGYGVRVNCVFPGLVPTEMGMKLAVETSGLGLFPDPHGGPGALPRGTRPRPPAAAPDARPPPPGPPGEAPDRAGAVVSPAPDRSSFATGSALPVDGG